MLLQELSQISKDLKIPICIVVLDHDYSHYEALSRKIEILVEKNNLCYSNTITSIKDQNFDDLVLFQTDFHPKAEANIIFADAIYNDLKKQSVFEKTN